MVKSSTIRCSTQQIQNQYDNNKENRSTVCNPLNKERQCQFTEYTNRHPPSAQRYGNV